MKINKLQYTGQIPRVRVVPPKEITYEFVPQKETTSIKTKPVDTGHREIKANESKQAEEIRQEILAQAANTSNGKASGINNKDLPLQVEHPELAMLFAPEFTTYGALGGAARVGLGLAGSRVGSYTLGKAGDWIDDKLASNFIGPTFRIVGGLGGYALGSQETYNVTNAIKNSTNINQAIEAAKFNLVNSKSGFRMDYPWQKRTNLKDINTGFDWDIDKSFITSGYASPEASWATLVPLQKAPTPQTRSNIIENVVPKNNVTTKLPDPPSEVNIELGDLSYTSPKKGLTLEEFLGKKVNNTPAYTPPVPYALRISTNRDKILDILKDARTKGVKSLSQKTTDMFGREIELPEEWVAAMQTPEFKAAYPNGVDYYWRGTDQDVLSVPDIKTGYPAVFGGDHTMALGYNAGGFHGGAVPTYSMQPNSRPNMLLLAVPKGTITDYGDLGKTNWQMLHNGSKEALEVSNKLYELNEKLHNITPSDPEWNDTVNKIYELKKILSDHVFKIEDVPLRSTDDVANYLRENDKLGTLFRNITDGPLGSEVIYNHHIIAPKIVTPYSTFEFNLGNKSFLKYGGKISKFQPGGIFQRFNYDNIYSNSHEDIKELQRALGVKADGMLGDKTIRALQRKFGVTADGIWGSASTKAAKTNISSTLNNVPQQTRNENLDYGTHTNYVTKDSDVSNKSSTFKTLTNTAVNLYDPRSVEGYMEKTASGKASASEIAQERMQTLQNYITNDIGRDVSYTTAKQTGNEKRPLVLKSEEFDQAEQNFNNQWISEGGNQNVMGERSIYDLGNMNLSDTVDRFNYMMNREGAVTNTPATLQVNQINAKSGDTPQVQLSDRDRDQWAREIGMNLTQVAELEAQRQQAMMNYRNAATYDMKQTYLNQVKQLSDRIGMASNATTMRYDGESQVHDPVPQGYMSLIKDIETKHNQSNEANLTPEEQQELQSYYNTYGISPQYSRMPWRQKYTLDHLNAAGYVYDMNDTSVEGMTQKFNDAATGSFTPRNFNGSNNGEWPMKGYRRGVTMHTNQLGDNIQYQFNQAPRDATGTKMNKPLFNISPSLAYDWNSGRFNIALSESGNYGATRANSPLFDKQLMSRINSMTRESYDAMTPEEKQELYKFLDSKGFNIEQGQLANARQQTSDKLYDDNSAWNVINQLNNASSRITSQGVQSGNNSLYHVPMQQTNNYTNAVYGNAIHGIQTINGQPSVFTQDLYDFNIGSIGPLQISAFGPGTYYKTAYPLSNNQSKTLGFKRGGIIKGQIGINNLPANPDVIKLVYNKIDDLLTPANRWEEKYGTRPYASSGILTLVNPESWVGIDSATLTAEHFGNNGVKALEEIPKIASSNSKQKGLRTAIEKHRSFIKGLNTWTKRKYGIEWSKMKKEVQPRIEQEFRSRWGK